MSISANESIPDTIANIKATTEHYKIVYDDKDLPKAFHEAGRGLLLIQNALETAEPELCENGLVDGQASALEACNRKSKQSESVIREVVAEQKLSRYVRYKSAVQEKGEGHKLEVLIRGMMQDVCNLAENNMVKAVTEQQIQGLRDAMDKLSKMEPSVPSEDSGHTFSSHDTSHQFNAIGGTQNNNPGNGNQFSGSTFNEAVNFTNGK
jgi:hypothetical protein